VYSRAREQADLELKPQAPENTLEVFRFVKKEAEIKDE
jgi:hypothetical protein